MTSFYSVVMLIAAMAVLCTLLEYLLPEGHLKKVALFSIGLIFLLAITTPIINVLHQPFIFEEIQSNNTVTDPALGAIRSHEELLRGYYDDILLE